MKTLPVALPPEVVQSIWGEILPGELDQKVLEAIERGDVMPSTVWSEAFVQAAMEFPHFANTKEIARALNADPKNTYSLVARVKRKARENRKC